MELLKELLMQMIFKLGEERQETSITFCDMNSESELTETSHSGVAT